MSTGYLDLSDTSHPFQRGSLEMIIQNESTANTDILQVYQDKVNPSSDKTDLGPTNVDGLQLLKHSVLAIPSLRPSLPSTVQLSLTVTYIVVFALIFFVVYVQLWMIWYYRHKRLSHQTLFLSLCLIWAGLRTSLFSFYFRNCAMVNDLDTPLYWLLYCLPVGLQFAMLCLLLHFYAQVVFKTRARYETAHYKYPLRIFLVSSVLIFMAINLVCATITRRNEEERGSVPFYILIVRISLNESMFLIYGILVSVCIYKMAKTPASRSVLEAKGTTVTKAVIATVLINVLFLSRTVYNLISIIPTTMKAPTFGYDWINVTDQADIVSHLSESLGYVSFGLVLFVWEVLPISIVMVLFRVKRLQTGQVLTDFSTQSRGSKVFFFDNPRRYDSEEDVSSQANSSYQQYDVNSSTRSLIEDGAYSGSDQGLWGSAPASYQAIANVQSHVMNPRLIPVTHSINGSLPQNH